MLLVKDGRVLFCFETLTASINYDTFKTMRAELAETLKKSYKIGGNRSVSESI